MTTIIEAAVFRTAGAPPAIEQVTIDAPRHDEVLVKIVAVGVCHTDMVLRDGMLPMPFPVVLGHEGSGIVLEVGQAVTGVSQGDHVVLSFDSCGHCPSCDVDAPAYCHSWFPLNFGGGRSDGTTALRGTHGEAIHSHIFGQSSFATHALVHERNLVKVDKDLPLELLGPLGCGIQTGAGTILNVLRPGSDSSVAVIGTGAVGSSAIMAARLSGVAKIVAVDLNHDRLAFALRLGATHVFDPRVLDMPAMTVAAGCAAGFDYIVDTTGNLDVVNKAIHALAPRGELALVGAYPPAQVEADASFLMSGGRLIRGIVEGGADPKQFIPQLLAHYRAGRFPFDQLIRKFAWGDLQTAIESGEQGTVLKPVVVMP